MARAVMATGKTFWRCDVNLQAITEMLSMCYMVASYPNTTEV